MDRDWLAKECGVFTIVPLVSYECVYKEVYASGNRSWSSRGKKVLSRTPQLLRTTTTSHKPQVKTLSLLSEVVSDVALPPKQKIYLLFFIDSLTGLGRFGRLTLRCDSSLLGSKKNIASNFVN